MTITSLAELLGQSETDVRGFLVGVSLWIEKGYTMEDAIVKHIEVMTHFANNAVKVAKVLKKDAAFVADLHTALYLKA